MINKKDTLAKGATKRFFGKFKPRDKDLKHFQAQINSCTDSGGEQVGGDIIDATEKPQFKTEMDRALHKLSGKTYVRKNPNGEREFLLHRGVSREEKNSADLGSHISYNQDSSWTSNYERAYLLSLEYNDPKHPTLSDALEDANNRVLSAWVPESAIKAVPNQHLGSENQRHDEPEIILTPHISEKADKGLVDNIKTKINLKNRQHSTELTNDRPVLKDIRKEKLKTGLFKSAATLEERIKHKLNLLSKSEVLKRAYQNKQLNLKNYEAFDAKPLGPEHMDPHWRDYNSDVFNGLYPDKDLQPGIGGKDRTTKVMRVVGKPSGEKAVIKTPTDWRELGLVFDKKHPAYQKQIDTYKKELKDWTQKRNSSVVAGEKFDLPKPEKPALKPLMLKRMSETSGFMNPTFRSTHREVTYDYLANKFFGLGNFVPKTGLFLHPKTKIPWSAQEYIEGDNLQNPENNHQHHTYSRIKHHADSGDLHKLAIMDTILGNNDRHWGNMKMDKNNHLKLIDNGGSFDYSNRFQTTEYPRYVNHLLNSPVPEHVHTWLYSLDHHKFDSLLKQANVPDILADMAKKRLEEMKIWSHNSKLDQNHNPGIGGAIDLARTHRLDADKLLMENIRASLRERIKRGEKTVPSRKIQPDEKTDKID